MEYLKGQAVIHFDNGEIAQVARDRKVDFENILKAQGISHNIKFTIHKVKTAFHYFVKSYFI